ncbi:MAG: Rieske 2Fe-2S domain-containing protein [Pseudomonadota bacterium]
MSRELDYLLSVRKEALGPYFEFLKKAGSHLDSKTRSLLSVVTKVDAQTEAGFKQYLTRALREGNSADKILDALLVCVPTLGFSKIIWAVEILLEMDIPEFHPDILGKEKQWHELGSMQEIENGTKYFKYGVRSCFVYKHDDELKVFDSRCPHQVTNIPEMALENGTLICPKHEWKFDVTTGKCVEKGKSPLKEVQFKIEDRKLFVYN